MNQRLLKQIKEMYEVDQDLRIRFAKPGRELANYLIYAIDAIHNSKIKEVLKKYGVLNKDLLGEKGMECFWLLIQHQDSDLDLQEACLASCDFKKQHKALLTDRVLVNSGQPQRFGTQFYTDKSGKFGPRPIASIKNLNKLRREHNLIPFGTYKKEILKKRKDMLGKR